MILPIITPRDSNDSSDCADRGSGICRENIVILYILAGVFVLIVAMSALIYFGCSDVPPGRSSNSNRRRLTRRKPSKGYRSMPSVSEQPSTLDPYHSMSSSFDDSLVLKKSSSKGARVPEPVHTTSNMAFPPPAYVPLPPFEGPEKATVQHRSS